VIFFVCDALGGLAFLRWDSRVVGVIRALSLCVWLFAGIRELAFRWHPRYVIVLQASPLCGAAPTFLCRRKEK